MTYNKDSSKDCELPAGFAESWRADAIAQGRRPEDFWSAQRRGIRARIQGQSSPRPRSLWLSIATAALFLIVLLIAPAGQKPRSTATRATFDADQELLLTVERALAAGTPEALEPLTLLVESSANRQEEQPISHKEQRHED